MLELSVKNEKGEILNITNSADYDLLKLDGLTSAGVNIGITEVFCCDGGTFSSAQVGTRNIVILLNLKNDIEKARVNLYRFFPEKQVVRLYIKTGLRAVYIDGYVETLEADLFSMLQQPQISIVCPNPFYIAQSEIELTHHQTFALFETPFEIPMNVGIRFSVLSKSYDADFTGGDVNSGIIFQITAKSIFASASDPKSIRISNMATGQSMTLSGIWLMPYDMIYINTFTMHKQIYIRRANGIENGMKYFYGTWPEITSGNNHLSVSDDTGEYNLEIKAQAFQYFSGV